MLHISEIKVRGYHLDLYGHVNNARYLELLEGARWEWLEEGGDLGWFMAQGYALVVSRIDIRYLRPACMGEILRIETQLAQLLARSALVRQRVLNADTGKVVAEADVTFAVIHPDKAGALPMTGDIAERLAPLLPSE